MPLQLGTRPRSKKDVALFADDELINNYDHHDNYYCANYENLASSSLVTASLSRSPRVKSGREGDEKKYNIG